MESMHKDFLLAALEQARLGRGQCAPNPSVGAVAVKDNQVIAKAWHKGAGTPHAEQLLLSQLDPGLDDVTLYVTLEPCNHWGRTPPCVNSIVEYGIKNVVFSYKDPNPLVKANDTPAFLCHEGIDVIHHPLEEIDVFYESYRYWIDSGLPFVTAKIAQSLDGKIAGSSRSRVHLSNELCHDFTHIHRLYADAILTTAATIINDNPFLNARTCGQQVSKTLFIIDRQLLLTSNENVFRSDSKKIIFFDSQLEPPVSSSIEYVAIRTDDDLLSLFDVMQYIGECGYHDIWVEAGAKLFSNLHALQLVNRTHVYITPTVLGPDAYNGYPNALEFSKAKLIEWQEVGNNMILSLTWNKATMGKSCLQD